MDDHNGAPVKKSEKSVSNLYVKNKGLKFFSEIRGVKFIWEKIRGLKICPKKIRGLKILGFY